MKQKLIKPYFTSLRVEATSKCNLGCKYCFANSTMLERKEEDMSLLEVERLLDMARKSKIRKILWSGGEPFSRDDFIDVLRLSHGIKTSFVTNGESITREHLIEISKMSHVNRIRFSIDGFDGHDRVRKGSSWKNVLEKIRICHEVNPCVSIVPQTTASSYTLDEIPELLSEVSKIGADRWRMFMLRFSGRISRGSVDINSKYYSDYVSLMSEIATISRSNNLDLQIEVDGGFQSNLDQVLETSSFPTVDGNTHPCQYLLHVLTIRSNGDIASCPFFELEIGNISSYSTIEEIETHVPLIAWRNQKLSNLKNCEQCRYLNICTGGCRKTAVDLLGSFYAEDPVFCYMMPLIEERVWPQLSDAVQNHYKKLLNENGSIPQWTANKLDAALDEFFSSDENYTK